MKVIRHSSSFSPPLPPTSTPRTSVDEPLSPSRPSGRTPISSKFSRLSAPVSIRRTRAASSRTRNEMDGPTSSSFYAGFPKGAENRMALIHRSALVAAFLWLLASRGYAEKLEADLKGFLSDEITAAREWEERLRAIPKTENLREYMRFITEEPHIAGLPGSKRVAEYVLSKFQSFGLNAWIEETQALMPLPTERYLELTAPESYVAKLDEPAIFEDKDSADPGQLPTYNAYAGEGDVEAQIVYANYGTPEDYKELDKMGIDVRGKIVIARYGRSWRGIKAKLAQSHGAFGCLIYSDPRDDGYFEGVTYPQGPFRPEHGVQRGSIMDMPVHPGDPLSPGFGANTDERRLAIEDAKTLIKIPVLPISYGDALPFLRNLRGKVAPEEWRGALPVTYHIGPGPSKVPEERQSVP